MLFVVPGDPLPLKKIKHANGKYYDDLQQLKLHWQMYVNHQNTANTKIDGPYEIIIKCFFPMPRNKEKLWPHLANAFHYYKPPAQVILKFVLDTIEPLILTKDAMLSISHVYKFYGYEPRIEFELIQLERKL